MKKDDMLDHLVIGEKWHRRKPRIFAHLRRGAEDYSTTTTTTTAATTVDARRMEGERERKQARRGWCLVEDRPEGKKSTVSRHDDHEDEFVEREEESD